MTSLLKRSVVAAAAAVALCGATAVQAYEVNLVEVQVPFAFVVHGQTFPAGRYIVTPDDVNPAVLTIRGEGHNHAVGVMETTPGTGHDPAGRKPALVFTRHDGQYELSAVWQSADEGEQVLER